MVSVSQKETKIIGNQNIMLKPLIFLPELAILTHNINKLWAVTRRWWVTAREHENSHREVVSK